MQDARRRLYALLGDLLLAPSPDAVALARALPALAPAFPADADADTLGASHHRVFGLEALPYAPVFLTEEGLLRDPTHDHFGAWLHAAADNRQDALGLLLRALPPFVLAVRDADDPGWTLVAELALELAVSDPRVVPGLEGPLPGSLPDLDAGETGLRDLATALVRPAVSGWFPTLRALGRVAAAAEVPGGFGGRVDRLHAVFLAAVDAGRAPALLAAIDVELVRWDRWLAELGDLGAPVAPWRRRIGETRAWLARVGSAAALVGDAGSAMFRAPPGE